MHMISFGDDDGDDVATIILIFEVSALRHYSRGVPIKNFDFVYFLLVIALAVRILYYRC